MSEIGAVTGLPALPDGHWFFVGRSHRFNGLDFQPYGYAVSILTNERFFFVLKGEKEVASALIYKADGKDQVEDAKDLSDYNIRIAAERALSNLKHKEENARARLKYLGHYPPKRLDG